MKCRQTGIVAEIFQKMGMTTVNMPGGEIIPSAQRGVIDCAEWADIFEIRCCCGCPDPMPYW